MLQKTRGGSGILEMKKSYQYQGLGVFGRNMREGFVWKSLKEYF